MNGTSTMVEILGRTSLPALDKEFKDAFYTKDGVVASRVLVGGKWVEVEGGASPVYSPIDNGVIAYVQKSSPEVVNEAVEKLHKARDDLRQTPAYKRAEMLLEAARILQDRSRILEEVLVVEAGKPLHEARGEVHASIERLKLVYQDLGRLGEVSIPGDLGHGTENKRAVVVRVPVGVVAAITPFNYPLFSAVAKIAPALLAGNPVILKPASNTPIIAAVLSSIFAEAGFERFLSFVTGPGGAIGDAIVSHPLVRAVTFTGSTSVGKRIASVAGLKKLHLELGGKAPALVFEDADLKLAAEKIVTGAYRLSGQRCDAVSRVIVISDVADELIELLQKEREKWRLGDPRNTGVNMGPLISEGAADKVGELVKDSVKKGGRLVAGGGRWRTYFEPTIIDNVSLSARIAWEETFGPAIPVIRARDEEEAVEIANKSEYGLDAAVFTSNVERAWRVALEVESGEVTVNDFPRHGLGLFPFGGLKDSGLGREGIGFSVEELTELKTIVFRVR